MKRPRFQPPPSDEGEKINEGGPSYWSATAILDEPDGLAKFAAYGERVFWSARLASKAPPVGVMTWFGPPLVDGEELDRSPRWQALVRTEKTGRAILMGDEVPIEVEGVMLRNVEKITKAAYLLLVNHAAWSTEYKPSNPDAAPNSPVDVTKMDSLF